MPEKIPFRQRAREVSRIEAFSDIVFGFALTLLVVALEVPKSYEELMHDMAGFLGFAICFATLMWIWHAHHTFFRRYAMTDGYTIVINSMLLFVVLYYTYPLKFIFSLVTGSVRRRDLDPSMLFLIYGLGFIGIFSLMLLLYLHAYHRREELQLNELEVHDTRTAMWMYGSHIAIGVLSVILAQLLPWNMIGLAGWAYALLGPVSAFVGAKRGYARRALQESLAAA
jgi:uncharacterized membrane protein